ncbi:2-oxoacid:acceptor oxidoreductase family protein [Chloroflexota bacterium]
MHIGDNVGNKSLTIGVVGAGGDGVVALGSLLQKLAALQGYYSEMPRYYGAQIRGGGSAVKLCLDAERLSMPVDALDILLCFDWEKYLEFEQELTLAGDTLVLHENIPPASIALPERSFQIDLSQRSRIVSGSTLDKNIVALGLLMKILALPDKQVRQLIRKDESLKMLKDKLSAFEAGGRLFSEMPLPDLRLAPPKSDSAKLVIHGNAAMARAAIRAGCRSFFGYPITPAAEIMQEMQAELSRNDGVFLQAEDEIASLGMALGASLVGAKAMTCTSGPGFDLMTEMMGLVSNAEIPLVVIDVQRCGPSTGIPSKSEQSDLNHAIYGGHGDAPRVVMAPYDVEGSYRLVIESFNIAHYFQVGVVLLSDQWLGQTFVAIGDEFLQQEYQIVERRKPDGATLVEYNRYQLTSDFISAMAAAGDEGTIYRSTGLAHNAKGEPAFDFETHQKMHEKRWQKLLPLCERDDLVKVFGQEDSRIGIITWGSSAQIVLETIGSLGLQNNVKICVPELLYPMPSRVVKFLTSVDRLLVIEMNYSGQLYHYLRSQVDLPRWTKAYTRAGGRPFSRKELSNPIGEMAK